MGVRQLAAYLPSSNAREWAHYLLETWPGPPARRPSALSSPSSVLFSPVTPVPSAMAALADGHSSRWPHLMRPTTSSLPATALRSRAVRSSSNLTPSQNALLVPNALLASLASARKKLLVPVVATQPSRENQRTPPAFRW